MKFIIFALINLIIAIGVFYLSTLYSFSKAKEYLGDTVVYKFNSHMFSARVTLKVLNVTHDFFQPYVQVKIMDGQYKGTVTQITFRDFLEHLQ